MLTPTLLRQGLLAASLLLISPAALAQTKVIAKPGKGTVIKEKTADGDKIKTKVDVTPATADPAGVMVGGATMLPSRDIVANAQLSQDHTTLVAAVKSAGLVETLKGAGPFTVFAPTNDAFSKVPPDALEKLMMPESKARLTSVLTYHVVPGALRADDLKDGQVLKTVQGQTLTVKRASGRVMLTDAMGQTVRVQTSDVISSNGVTHVVDGVLMPKQ